MKKPVWFCLIALAVVFMMSSVASAEEKAEPRLITVTGEAEVLVVPDEAVLMLGVETITKDLSAAKAENDQNTKKILEAVKKLNVLDKDIQTDRLNIEPQYNHSPLTGKKTFDGYSVSRVIAVTLRDVSKTEDLVSDVLKAGANSIYSLDFRTSSLKKCRDQARALAIKAAQEKANLLATQLGQTVGKPHTINEGVGNYSGGFRSGGFNSINQYMQTAQVVSAGSSSSDTESAIALGQIKVTASVTVSFELQ